MLDKFGVSGVFEGCKGEKGSQEKFGDKLNLASRWEGVLP